MNEVLYIGVCFGGVWYGVWVGSSMYRVVVQRRRLM